MKITQFDRTTLKALRVDLDAALAKVGKKYGVSLTSGNARFSPESFSMKIEGAVVSSGGVVMTKEARNLELYADIDGLRFGYGDTFTQRGKTFKVTGYKPSRPKFPVSASDVNSGRAFKFPLKSVNLHFPRK